MDRARDFEFVKQLPRTTVPELEYRDDVYDRQVLLNETWQHYAIRVGYATDRINEEHVKWVTESWEEYEARVPQRQEALHVYESQQEGIAAENSALSAARFEKSKDTVRLLMEQEDNTQGARVPTLHTLYVDFEEEQLLKMARERSSLEDAESEARTNVSQEEESERAAIYALAVESLARVEAELEAQRLAREAEENRIREEQRLKAEALRAEEERKRLEAEEAERKRREAEEEAKRAERRRKDEERKNKAKAEREARARQARGGAAKPTAGSTKDDDISAARNQRNELFDKLAGNYLEALRKQCASVRTSDELLAVLSTVPEGIGNGNVLFHGCVYVGIVAKEDTSTTVTFQFCSANCSAEMKAVPTIHATPDAPKKYLTLEECCANVQSTGVRKFNKNEGGVLVIGSAPDTATGDFISVPIVVGDVKPFAVLSVDTLSSNAKDAENVTNPLIYDEHGGDGFKTVSLAENHTKFIHDVAAIISSVTLEAATEVPVAEPATSSAMIDFDVSSIRTITGLVASATNTLHKSLEGCSAYIATYATQTRVVSHNGIALADPMRHQATVDCHLLGCTIENNQALSHSPKLVSGAQILLTAGNNPPVGECVELVGDVRNDSRCMPYVTGAEKTEETLLAVPIPDTKGGLAFILGVSKPGANSFTDEEIAAIVNAVSTSLVPRFIELQMENERRLVATQAVEWIELTTGHSDVYVSVSHDPANVSAAPLTYIAATESQKWVLDRSLQPGQGISFPVMQSEDGCVVVPDVSDSAHPNAGQIVYLDEAKRGAKGALAVFSLRHNGVTYGCLYADTLNGGKKHEFTPSDVEVLKTTAAMLAAVLAGESSKSATTLAIENEVGADRIKFLKLVWEKVTTDIAAITKDQLLELARYNNPPPIIPITVGATLILALGTKPSAVENWEGSKKRVKYSLLEKIAKFDPTGPKRKKAFFTRARKMTKDMTANDVFTRGSYPASCFFTWTFVSLLLRRASDKIRKQVAAGMLDNFDDVATSAGDTTLAEEEGIDDDVNSGIDEEQVEED